MNKTAVVLLAEGFEEIEAVTCIDMLRRAEIHTSIAAITSALTVTGAHGIIVHADVVAVAGMALPDVLVLPGGMPGSEHLARSPVVDALLVAAAAQRRVIAALCAAPALVLAPKGLLAGKQATCYPGMERYFNADTRYVPAAVVVDGRIITGNGPGGTLEFALAIIEQLCGREQAAEIRMRTLMR